MVGPIFADFRAVPLATHFLKMALGIPGGLLDGHRRAAYLASTVGDLDSLESTGWQSCRMPSCRRMSINCWKRWGGGGGSFHGMLLWHSSVNNSRKTRVPNLADPVALFRGNDSLLLEAEHACCGC